MNFNVDGQNYGNLLVLTIKIKEGKITEFRNKFDLSEEDYTKGKLIEILKKNNYNEDKAFEELFN